MIDHATDGFFAVDFDWRYTYVSEEGARLAGQSRDDLVGERVWETFPEVDETAFGDVLRETMDEREANELEAYYPAHESRYAMRVYPTENGLSIYFRDVTEERERAQQFEAIFNNTYTFVGLLDTDGTLLEANETALEFGGLDREEVIGKPIWDTYWFQVDQHARRTAREAVRHASRGELFQDEVGVRGADREIVIDFTVRPVTNEEGEVTHLIPEGRDITRRERLTQQLREERDFVEKALDTLNDLFYVVGPDGTFRRWNSQVSDVTGYTDDEIDDMRAIDFFPEDEADRITAAIEETLATGETVLEAELPTATGERIPYEFTGARLTDTDGELIGLVGVGRDVSEKKARERELRGQREQLAALNSLNTVVRDITDAVIEQTTREEIERITCEKLARSDSYTTAWIADADPDSRELSSWSGSDAGTSHENPDRPIVPEPLLEQRPVRATFETGEMEVAHDVLDDPAFEPWRDVAREHGFRSLVTVPIAHDETRLGVLGIHSERANAFEGEEREIIEQLSEVVGYVFFAIERKEQLGSALEFEFRSERLADPFPDDEGDEMDVRLEGVVPLDGQEDEFIEYWEVNDGSIEAFQEAVDHLDPKLDFRLHGISDGIARFEVPAGARAMSSVFASHGGTLQSVSLEDNAAQLVAEFPETADPEATTAELRETFPDIEFVSRKRVLTPQYLRRMVDENLTPRQRTVLQLAHSGGYFGQPRRRTGEELAAHLDITKQTFHHHLRRAESAVFELVFEDPDDPLI